MIRRMCEKWAKFMTGNHEVLSDELCVTQHPYRSRFTKEKSLTSLSEGYEIAKIYFFVIKL